MGLDASLIVTRGRARRLAGLVTGLFVAFSAGAGTGLAADAPGKAQKPASGSKATTTGTAKTAKNAKGKKMSDSVYEFSARALDGKNIDLSAYKGDVVLIVNTASQCGYTPQYKGLEELHTKYKDRGLKVLGFPCNQFGNQEPGDSAQIATFCKKNYGVDFQMFEKIDVNGNAAHPLYKYLTASAPGLLGTEAIKWNFTKFLIDRQGRVIKRYAPDVEPTKIAGDIAKVL